MNGTKIGLCVLLTILIVVGTTFIRYQSLVHDFWISYLLFFSLVIAFVRKFPENKNSIILSILLTLLAIHSFGWLADGTPPTNGLMNILGQFMACISGYSFAVTKKNTLRIFIIGFSVTICVFYFFWGEKFWKNYLNYGTFTGIVNEKVYNGWVSFAEPLDDKMKIQKQTDFVVLDFYITSCGYCFKAFPFLQKMYDKYKSNEHISIYSVNIPIPRDTPGIAIQMIRDRHYTFPVIVGKSGLDSLFNVQVYPTVILLKGDSVIFRGNIEDANNLLTERLAP